MVDVKATREWYLRHHPAECRAVTALYGDAKIWTRKAFLDLFKRIGVSEEQGWVEEGHTAPTWANGKTSSPAASLPQVDPALLERLVQAEARRLFQAEAQAMVAEAVKAEVAKATQAYKGLEVTCLPFGETSKIDTPHPALPKVLKLLSLGLPVLLVGPAGSGKTTLASQCAKLLKLQLYRMTGSPDMTAADLYGRQLGTTGKFVETEFVRSVRSGGLLLFDEGDRMPAELSVVWNSLLGDPRGGEACYLSNPLTGEVFPRHPDFRLILCANTFGRGADRQYVAAQQLDAAFLDRFAASTVYVDYAPSVEEALIRPEVLRWIRRAREVVAQHHMRRIISTRLGIAMSMRVEAGESLAEVIEDVLSSWNPDERARLQP